MKPFFIRSLEVESSLSSQIINKFGIDVTPCKTPTTVSIKSVSPLDEGTFAFVDF